MQERFVLGITVKKALSVVFSIGSQPLPRIEELINCFAKRRMSANDVGGGRSIEDLLHDLRPCGLVTADLTSGAIVGQVGDQMTGRGDDDRGQCAIHGARCPWRYAGSLYGAVEAGMKVPEALVMKTVARLMGVEEHQHEPRFVHLTTDTARCLDILSGGLWLSLDDHQAETGIL